MVHVQGEGRVGEILVRKKEEEGEKQVLMMKTKKESHTGLAAEEQDCSSLLWSVLGKQGTSLHPQDGLGTGEPWLDTKMPLNEEMGDNKVQRGGSHWSLVLQ